MKKLFPIIILIICISYSFKNDCKRLANGNYKVELDSVFRQHYGTFDFLISDSICLIKRPKSVEQFKIEWLPNCGFKLTNDLNSVPHDPENKFLAFGNPWYDIIKTEQDTVYFIYRLNLHIQIYSGRLIKKPN